MKYRFLFICILCMCIFSVQAADAPKLFMVCRGGETGYIDQKGKVVIPFKKYHAWHFFDGVTFIAKNGRWGLMDETGKVVVDFGKRYDSIDEPRFNDGLFPVTKNGMTGFINKDGAEVIKPQFKGKVVTHSAGLLIVRDSDLRNVHLLSRAGEVLVKPGAYFWIQPFTDGLALVKKENPSDPYKSLNGFINTKGTEVIPAQYEMAIPFSEGIAIVRKDSTFYGLNTNGAVSFQVNFASCFNFSDSVALAKDKETGLFGYIDHSGKWIIKPQFDLAHGFSEGLAAAVISGRWRFMDKSGATIFKTELEYASDSNQTYTVEQFQGGLVRIRSGKKIGYLNRDGKWVWPLTE